EITLVTGRSFHFTMPIARLLPVPLTIVCNNGALVKDADGGTRMRFLLPRDTARVVLAETPAYDDSVALVFDRQDERQVMFDRMDCMHPNRQRYYERNKAFIARAPGPLADLLTEDPVQVMFNGSVAPMRALAALLASLPAAHTFSVAITE